MLPLMKRQGSQHHLINGNSMYGVNHSPSEESSSPLDGSRSSPFMDASPFSSTTRSGIFAYKVEPLSSETAGVAGADFHFKRLRSGDSFTTDTSPTSNRNVANPQSPLKAPRLTVSTPAADDFLKRTGRREARKISPKSIEEIPEDLDGTDNIPLLRLGDEGRSKLKSALSDQVRVNPDIKAEVDAIGKIRLASMQQLLKMAMVSGLWAYAVQLAREHEFGKSVKRSS